MTLEYTVFGEEIRKKMDAKATSWRRLAADKQAIREAVAQMNAAAGFVPGPTATPEKAQEYMVTLGIRPEDNIFSCGIIAARNEE